MLYLMLLRALGFALIIILNASQDMRKTDKVNNLHHI